jgi:hypothetical protein
MSFEYPVHVFYREHRIDICIGNGFFCCFSHLTYFHSVMLLKVD